MENKNKEQKNNNEDILQNGEEIESLNDNEELNLEDLEGIDGGNVVCPKLRACGSYCSGGGSQEPLVQ
ncbi:MAG: hypothetical protein QNJ64_19850 [Crocosphaera sp.]|nr:hypothetical protein [Crocosphaera sp.]